MQRCVRRAKPCTHHRAIATHHTHILQPPRALSARAQDVHDLLFGTAANRRSVAAAFTTCSHGRISLNEMRTAYYTFDAGSAYGCSPAQLCDFSWGGARMSYHRLGDAYARQVLGLEPDALGSRPTCLRTLGARRRARPSWHTTKKRSMPTSRCACGRTRWGTALGWHTHTLAPTQRTGARTAPTKSTATTGARARCGCVRARHAPSCLCLCATPIAQLKHGRHAQRVLLCAPPKHGQRM